MQSNLKAFRIALMLVLSLFIGTVSAQTDGERYQECHSDGLRR